MGTTCLSASRYTNINLGTNRRGEPLWPPAVRQRLKDGNHVIMSFAIYKQQSRHQPVEAHHCATKTTLKLTPT